MHHSLIGTYSTYSIKGHDLHNAKEQIHNAQQQIVDADKQIHDIPSTRATIGQEIPKWRTNKLQRGM